MSDLPEPGGSSPRRTFRRSLALRLGALALAAAVSAGVAESALRLVHGAPLPNRRPLLLRGANRARGWQMIPRQDHYTYDRPVRLNELGLRGADVGARRPGELRVLALGDSLVYGQGVVEEETLPAYLERALEEAASAQPAAGGTVRVVNAGHRGYATHEELALLEELGPAIAPDVVVLYWYWNDVLETDRAEMFEWLTRTGPVAFDTAYRLEGLNLWRWRLRQLGRRSALVVTLNDAFEALRFEEPAAATLQAYEARFDEYMARLAALGRERGFRLLFAVIPDRNALDGRHFSSAPATRMEEIASRHGIPVVPLVEPVAAVTRRLGRPPVVPYDGHWSGPANRAMAERTAARMRELGWVPAVAATAVRAGGR